MKKILYGLSFLLLLASCETRSPAGDSDKSDRQTQQRADKFLMGADLSYVNQVLDHGGTYRDSGAVENPYQIFREYGIEVARFRLWHNPDWVQKEVYDESDVPLYSGLADVTKSIREAKSAGMKVNLDFHYSDTWADPETQNIPAAWRNIRDLEVLKDSVYQYTKQTLQHLNEGGLMPEYVQVGNETNCGLMYSNAPEEFPKLNVCDGNWKNAGEVIKSGIKAVRAVASNSDIDTKIILHIAQPENVQWWFDNITDSGEVNDFDILGFSYYTPWSEVPLEEISDYVSDFREKFEKEVMIVETAYPWTLKHADNYRNIFGQDSLVEGYPASKEGQRNFMIALTKEIKKGGGSGIMYWEPAWITSKLQTQWGKGSAWENNTFFDFKGRVHKGIEFMTYDYSE